MSGDYDCIVCGRDTEKFDAVFQIYLTKPHTYTDCLGQTFVCTPCIGEFAEFYQDYIKLQ